VNFKFWKLLKNASRLAFYPTSRDHQPKTTQAGRSRKHNPKQKDKSKHSTVSASRLPRHFLFIFSTMTTTATTTTSQASAATEKSTITQAVPKSRNVSGRGWKLGPQKRASALVKTKFNNQARTWEELQAAKRDRKQALELQKEMSEEKRKSAIEKKERRLENEKRRAENEFKNMQKSVQTLNNNKVGLTLKALSKKQLRQIKKTRMNQKTGVVEFVSAYAK
jgi:hypothetical protein